MKWTLGNKRVIHVPLVDDEYFYSAGNSETGEILECADLANLLRHVAVTFAFGDPHWLIMRRKWDKPLPKSSLI